MGDKKFYVKFFAPVIPETIAQLMQIVDSKVREQYDEMVLLISTPGGSVFHGLSAYNYLKGIPLKITAHNFGSADSIGVVMFCAGERRYAVPQSRFLIHGVTTSVPPSTNLEEKQLEEMLKGLQIDMGNIASVIGCTIGRSKEEITNMMLDRTTFYPNEAMAIGLIHEVKQELFEKGAEVYSIQMNFRE